MKNELRNLDTTGKVEKTAVYTDIEMVRMTDKVLQWHKEKLAELAPKAAVYDKIADSSGLKTIQEVAAIFNIGSKTFFDNLRRDGILYVTGGTNLPKREHIEAGRFKVVEEPFKIGQITNVYSRIFVTPKGELWLAQKYGNSNSHLLIEG